ncbi:1,2-phenylacetyl-CoA epoxidase subunit PaaE [Lipingzhangella sp. LS1_29]|uniref:1,2-phenylacetyl-CoA epoxidase subunit PaaE n=1 Tax=Lipingzhangella rawalii TaxID=2055835 RepID=A0ABU2H9A1_9ACTN|nr:1,2-phenylacetyl-CoA epoxidase subunit PaaE [Lipingzhangella rawalii]MDS1271415.1 1,2-phenylacetyl-CoA epoxidase subunit PaaE [Lipingzhangella rawalii]
MSSASTAPETRDTSAAPRSRRFHRLRVADVERLCADAAAVRFEIPPELAETFAHRPGQSMTLRRFVDGREERRDYSICAPVGEPPRVGVRLVPGGALSTWLVSELEPGTEVEVQPPRGRFTPDLDVSAHHALLAAGAGITPILSIAASLLSRTRSRVTLVYGNRRSDTVMFADELADLKDRYPERLELLHVLSREPRESDLLSGRLDAGKIDLLLRELVDPDHVDHWWLCGPLAMVQDARRSLDRRGVPPARVHRELFYVGDAPPEPLRHEEPPSAGSGTAVTVVLDGRASTHTLPRDVPILDAAQRFRADLPFACKGGVCGTCRVLVRDGEVTMRRNFALEQDELDAGFALSCQSLPVTDQVTVDYDA